MPKTGKAMFTGHPPVVGISRRQPNALELKARGMLMGRMIVDVSVQADQMTIKLDDGGEFSMSCEGGFKQSS